ncbi:MAG: hypothetical protein EXR73_04565 [Myxococcales bacterium]|nr:hypothetical protein [Myxococcales bacterium]
MTSTRTAGAIVWLALVIGATATGGCGKKKEAAKSAPGTASVAGLPAQSEAELGQIIADIDGVKITLGDFQERINKQSPYVRARYTSLERKKEFLDNLVRFEVLAREAKKKGYDQDPEVVRTMKQVMIQKLMKAEFDTRVKPEDVTDAEMQAFYKEHESEYNKPEEARISAVIVKDAKTAAKVATEAKSAKGADNKGFRDLVTQYSQDEASKALGGDLRYFAVGTKDVPAEVVTAAFTLVKTGDVAGPIKAGDRFYVIKQTGRRKALAKTFEDVKRQIQNRIYRDKRTKAMEDFVGALKTAAKIQVNDVELAKVRIDMTGADATAPGAGDGHDDPHGGLGLPGATGLPAPLPAPTVPAAAGHDGNGHP